MKPNIDLTDERDFNRLEAGNMGTRLLRRGSATTNSLIPTQVTSLLSEDEFIARMYTSDFIQYLFDNEGKVCDRCGKYDHFDQMKYALCFKCDETFEVFRVETFPTGNRKMIKTKKEKWGTMNSLEDRLARLNGNRVIDDDKRIPWT